MSGFELDELTPPTSVGDPSWADFVASVAVRNACEVGAYATPELAMSAEELLPHWLDPREPRRWWVARAGGEVVARGLLEWQLDDDERVAWVTLQVDPAHWRLGIGRAIADVVEDAAREHGFSRMLTYAPSADAPGEQLVPPTGAGGVPRSAREVRFLLARGWRLEQVARASRFPLPADRADLDRRRDAATEAAGGYRVHTWAGPTPERWLADLAHLRTRMSTEEPSAGLEPPEDRWDAQRVREHDDHMAQAPLQILTAVVEHIASGGLAGFTQLSVPHEPTQPVTQYDTLVLPEHRGHRLGMLLKVANLLALEDRSPGHPSVLTWNAEENRPMLDVNEAVGFVRIGAEGAWRKDL
ncbi:MAG: GNAT family N-acetyltransferase [Schumannella sp.]|nr:GNAT family N-acetyltransferase [Microbacteriaceae bacterium]